MRYFDSGVLLKLYVLEPRSAEAALWAASAPRRVPMTRLHELELRSALRQKVGRKEITLSACQQVLENLESDIKSGVFDLLPVDWETIFRRSQTLSDAHGIQTLCRTLDTLHVALALELGAQEFCSLDGRQCQMAKAAGLLVLP